MMKINGFLLLLCLPIAAQAAVTTYPAPTSESLSSDFQVWADDRQVDVYSARVLDPPFAGKQWDFGGPYSFANFDMEGRTTVRIVSKRSLRNTVIRPASAGARMNVVDDHTLSLSLDAPQKVSIEPDGKRGPLLLFANPMETQAPKAGDADVIFFGPGSHKPDLIQARDNQTVYLAGGAVVKGAIVARGTNIQIRGRGILDGSDYEWRKGPHPFTVGIYGTNITVSDITIRGSSHWTIVPRGIGGLAASHSTWVRPGMVMGYFPLASGWTGAAAASELICSRPGASCTLEFKASSHVTRLPDSTAMRPMMAVRHDLADRSTSS